MAAGVYQASDVKQSELIEIDDVVKYIQQELIAKVKAYFNNITYNPTKALGTDSYTINSDRNEEAQLYLNADTDTSFIKELIGSGAKGHLISALDLVAALQLLVKQLSRFRYFTASGKKRYDVIGKCDKGDCRRTVSRNNLSTVIPETSGYIFLPATSAAYNSTIQKTIGSVITKTAVTNTKNIESNNNSYGVCTGQLINAQNFRNYISALFNEWKQFVSNHTIVYYSEECHSTNCVVRIAHDSSRR